MVRLKLRRAAGSLRRDERGLAIVLTSLVLIPLLVVTATAVDLGNARSESVQLQATVDAASLAAVPDLPIVADDLAGRSAARVQALTYVRENLDAPDINATWCSGYTSWDVTWAKRCYTDGEFDVEITTPYPGSNTVPAHQRLKVEVCQDTADMFSSAAGLTPPRVCRSAVSSGMAGGVNGLRPFGLCYEAVQAIKDLVTSGIIPSTPVTITYAKTQAAACNGGSSVPGNWGMIDFNGGSNSNAETQSWVSLGYYGIVEAGTTDGTCATQPLACYQGDTGAFSNSLDAGLSYLKTSGIVFALPIFDEASGTGANARIHLVGFASVKLIDYRATGSQANRFLRIQIMAPGMIPGPQCCVQSGTLEG